MNNIKSLDDVQRQVKEIMTDKNSVATTFAGLFRNVINQCELVRQTEGVSSTGTINMYMFSANLLAEFSASLIGIARALPGADEYFKKFDAEDA